MWELGTETRLLRCSIQYRLVAQPEGQKRYEGYRLMTCRIVTHATWAVSSNGKTSGLHPEVKGSTPLLSTQKLGL